MKLITAKPREGLLRFKATSKRVAHYSGMDNTYVQRPLMANYHSGLQAVIYGSGKPGEWSPGGFDPLKKTIYFNFDEEMQQVFGFMAEYGERPSTESPEPGDELGNKLKERAGTEPDREHGDDESGASRHASGLHEYVTAAGVLRTDEKGHVLDTLKIKVVGGKMDFDTIPTRKK
jgi:hypothetical protein